MRYDASREALYRPESKPVFVDIDHMPRFESGQPALSLVNTWWLSNASHLAYYKVHRLERELDRAGLNLVDYFTASSTQAFLAASDSYAILGFRGTESDNLADLKTDADIRLSPFENGARVHRGFLAALDQVWAEVDERLTEMTARGLSIWYTGHSLGAALATLAAARRKPDALYTFGSPRVGDDGFARLLDTIPIQRVVNCSDMATTVPGRFLGYRHVGDQVFMTSTAGLFVNPTPMRVFFSKAAANVKYGATLPWLRRGRVAARSFADHAIVNYTAALMEAIARQIP
jgi:triacylglycerol lipase